MKWVCGIIMRVQSNKSSVRMSRMMVEEVTAEGEMMNLLLFQPQGFVPPLPTFSSQILFVRAHGKPWIEDNVSEIRQQFLLSGQVSLVLEVVEAENSL